MNETQLNQAYRDDGWDAVVAVRGGTIAEVLGQYALTGASITGATWATATDIENARSGTIPTLSGTSGSNLNLGDLCGITTRAPANGGLTVGFSIKASTFTSAGEYNSSNGSAFRIGSFLNPASSIRGMDYGIYPGSYSNRFFNSSTYTRIFQSIFDGYWHTIHYVYSHKLSVGSLYVDGEFWDAATIGGSFGNSDSSTVPILTNWMLGAHATNGPTANDSFACSITEVQLASRPMSLKKIVRAAAFARSAYLPSQDVALRAGSYKAESLGAMFSADVSKNAAVIGMLGDSTYDWDVPHAAMARAFGSTVGRPQRTHIRTWQDAHTDDDANNQPGVVSIAAGATVVYPFYIMANPGSLENSTMSYVVGGGAPNFPGTRVTDLTDGMNLSVMFRKIASGAGTVTYKIEESTSPILGNTSSSNDQVRALESGTLLIAAQMTGTGPIIGKGLQGITPLGTRYFRLSITNNGSATIKFSAVTIGPRSANTLINMSRGGYEMVDINTNYSGMFSNLAALGLTYIVVGMGLNDGWARTPAAFVSQMSTFISALYVNIPTLKAVIYAQPPARTMIIDSTPRHSILSQGRMDTYGDAMREWFDSNQNYPGFVANAARILREGYGWTPLADSLIGKTVTSLWTASLNPAADSIVPFLVTSNYPTQRQYRIVTRTAPAGTDPNDASYYAQMPTFHVDGTHHNNDSSGLMFNAIWSAIMGNANDATGITSILERTNGTLDLARVAAQTAASGSQF